MTAEPEIAAYKPCLVEVRGGKSYLWCACGRSRRQPFCDGSHKGTGLEPLRWTADKNGEVLLCACKHTKSRPFCDGTHNMLSETYAEANESDGADAVLVGYEAYRNGTQRALLDNGCYVIRATGENTRRLGTLAVVPLIDADSGAEHLSQYLVTAESGASPVIEFPGSDVVLFIESGAGTIRIGSREYKVARETGVCIKPGEAFQVVNDEQADMIVTVSACPLGSEMIVHETMPPDFDQSIPERTQGVDEEKQQAMGDRFFQVLIDHDSHGTPVTQFIGEIPRSRAAHHHHLYEETIMVLSGEGFMWTDKTRTPVRPGDTIFLPLKQAHSLECTSDSGMRLIGLFYPSMSPAINY
ncbi:MAG: CDGSH iron-sulfur domain-containing protein [Gammaproteobacteria bacterium]|nr:CDGSH iron-sulfur domain-containing protein [Gammaproteobacteria bacterium]